MEEIEQDYKEPKLTPQDIDDLWEMEQRVERINCYTDLLKRIDKKCQPNILSVPTTIQF